jgi:integrase
VPPPAFSVGRATVSFADDFTRWSELRAVRVRAVVEIPMPLLVVQRAAPEGVEARVTKGGRARRVPLADRVLPLVRDLARERDCDDLLFVTNSGHWLHASALKRTVAWSTISGAGGSMTCGTRRRVSGWPEVWTRQRCRPGWGTPRSRRLSTSPPGDGR